MKLADVTVSIHAPAWGATQIEPTLGVSGKVSIHAPAWGATDTACQPATSRRFQSTLPRGERRDFRPLWHTDPSVSIHAPAWGATAALLAIDRAKSFQSTLPRGERPQTIRRPRRKARFNPRSRVGSD